MYLCAVRGVRGGFQQELSDAVVAKDEHVIIGFVTSNKAPDLTHKMLNGTEQKLVASGICKSAAKAYGCECTVTRMPEAGYNVTIVCPARPLLAGTFIGTDNDDAVTAHKTEAELIVVGT